MDKQEKNIDLKKDKWWNRISENNKVSLVILGVLIFEVLLLVLFWWIVDLITLKYFLIYVFTSLAIFLLCDTRVQKCNKIIRKIWLILMLPMYIIFTGLKLIFPAFTIFMSYLMVAIYSLGSPLVIIKAFDYLCNLNFSMSTIVFITLTAGAILCVHRPNFIQWIIKKQSPLKDWGEHKYEPIMQELALYVTHKNNINFFIYTAYFVFFTISGFMEIQYNEALISQDLDKAVLKAFLVFIAYSNMVGKSKEVEIKSKPLLDKIIRLITIHD